MRTIKLDKRLCAALALAACGYAGADTIARAPAPQIDLPEAMTEPVIAPAASPDLVSMLPELVLMVADPPGFDGPSVSSQRLAGVRGGADTVTNDMQLSGAVTSNTAVNVLTGANTISSGSFSNASGLPIAIQNSGANVLIQNATIINVQMQ